MHTHPMANQFSQADLDDARANGETIGHARGYEEAETMAIQLGGMTRVDIPVFYGTSEDKVTAEEYCGIIHNFWILSHPDKAKRIRQNQMVIRTSMHLRGPAAKWYRNLEKDGDPLVTGYVEGDPNEVNDPNKTYLAKFLAEFKKRWQSELNPTDKMHLRINIKQKHGEKVLDFYARVRADMRDVLEGAQPEAAPDDTESAEYKMWVTWQKYMLNNQVETYFLDGMNPRIRTEITKGTWKDLDDLKEKAHKYEIAMTEIDDRRKGTASTHAVEASQDYESMSKKELVTMLINGQQGGSTFRGRGRGTTRGGGGRGRGGRGGRGGSRPPVQCFYCGITGHYIRECRKKKSDNEKGIDNPKVPKREVGANDAETAEGGPVDTYDWTHHALNGMAI